MAVEINSHKGLFVFLVISIIFIQQGTPTMLGSTSFYRDKFRA